MEKIIGNFNNYKVDYLFFDCGPVRNRRWISDLVLDKRRKTIKLCNYRAIVLIAYGIIPTLQPANFGRVYAAYGGVFIVLSIIWGWGIDGIKPDKFDLIGGCVALVGVTIIMYWTRT